MKRICTFMLSALALPLSLSAQTTTPPTGYKMVWSDEFNGTSLDTKVWNIEENGNGGGNQELQYYRKENVAVANGNLVLTARRENYNNKQFTSGRINSRDKAYFKHGIIQARIKFPKTANGVWPAYWMMGNDYGKLGWPRCGEIDIVETGNAEGIKNGTQTRHFGATLHWGTSAGANHKQYGTSYLAPENNPLQNDEYHIITTEWDGQFLSMYYDLQDFTKAAKNKARFYSATIPASTNSADIGHYFQKPFFFIFNLAVGGNYTGIYNAGGITALPNAGDEAKMFVDWVRVYQDEADAEAQYKTPDGDNTGSNPDTHPTEDNTTKIGQYATKALEGGQSTFDLTNVSKAVLIGTSSGVTDALTDVTVKNYNVDEKTNFFWIWDGGDYTGLPSNGKNSFGWDESSTRLQVTGNSTWCGAGYASQGTGKDLSMIDDTWYLHFAMRGDDALTHPSQTVTVGNAVFVIGNATSGQQIVGDYRRDGEWYNFDIPVAKLKQIGGGTLFNDAANFMGNVFAVATTHNKGAEVNFDQVFFYSKKDGGETPDIPTYVKAALDNEGKSTFDVENTGNYVLIGTTGGVTTTLAKKVKADYNVDDVNSALYIWEGTMTASNESGVNSFGYDEGGYPVYTVGTVGWSGLGYASKAKGKDMSMLDDTYYLHLGMKATNNAPYLIAVGNAKFAIGASAFVDGGTSYAPLCDFPRDGKWYNIDIPYSEIEARATKVFDNAEDVTGNVLYFLAGGTTGTKLTFDQIFFYNDGSVPSGIDAVKQNNATTGNNRTYTLSGVEVKGDNLPKGIYIRNGKKIIVR